ncbi:IS3 family transposase [Salmonella enterica]|uniref:IS3 family transposase n=3 Tax=Salmonella enterica TaxID=28901 RepID=A0A5V5CXM4_SALER|nr:hypothetical protein [Salmonella enterica subsp. enterica serovar Pensacola]EAO9158180.1 hypothetical protein [Salmonella enterica]EBL4322943.1 IS3 family transposase [Salmonella enterica subsp. enterica serovar Give]EBU7357578.1 hypothetical protein [Salmonella enterica subsp. enterica serovar Poona]EBV0465563.1 hypothetical protein [Salmonella enterica subsp. enterica serovar Newport]EBW8396452.1 hypothetical protein [Salmonella enterica subsp. enterica serovar Florida]EBX2068112.1 hypot
MIYSFKTKGQVPAISLRPFSTRLKRFQGTLKNENLSHCRFTTRNEAISVVREYIGIFYKRRRRHSRLSNLSSAVFGKDYYRMTT